MRMSKELKEKQKQERLGEENYNNYKVLMKIIEYNNNKDIIVEFQDEHNVRIHTTYNNFKKGNVKNPYHPSIYGVGYLGEGKYKPSKNGKSTKAYKVWLKMLQRCYEPYYLNRYPTYRDCYVCEKWHNFQNFAEWWEKKVYNCNNEKMCLDKDILIKGNKIYSPETCLILPERINTLFIKCDALRGKYPIGVYEYYDKKGYKYLHVQCSIFNKDKKTSFPKSLGYFPINEPFHAFYTYKIFKENYIKQVADEYKDLIPTKLYEAMYRYEVEIND